MSHTATIALLIALCYTSVIECSLTWCNNSSVYQVTVTNEEVHKSCKLDNAKNITKVSLAELDDIINSCTSLCLLLQLQIIYEQLTAFS